MLPHLPSHTQMRAWLSLSPLPTAQAEGQSNGAQSRIQKDQLLRPGAMRHSGHKLLSPRGHWQLWPPPLRAETKRKKANACHQMPLLRHPQGLACVRPDSRSFIGVKSRPERRPGRPPEACVGITGLLLRLGGRGQATQAGGSPRACSHRGATLTPPLTPTRVAGREGQP